MREKLRELNEEDYMLVVDVIEKAVAGKEHIEQDERRETIRYRLNEALKHEGWNVTRAGNVQPIERDYEK